ncbi:GPI mannosyltransferase 3-like isoform X2 [Pollicipes pollicipes]|uniref:GPI mannosyltransferase 3-like isoform X2 n=1 Tax=Pollicipes pollicipes TaxID=41117 RepID=UPI00188554C1|nr:GPI mannosyltransferase 3-like isoform X2 [Pollicipes pollicipes]XP_037070568.1 GPI mannosyltransferase 3-like isoform X2 [Pollicipes pollicipes]
MKKWTLVLLAIRLASVVLTQTSFVPDEYWQSLEIAHKISFGYGYSTWEWREGIRSYLLPLLIGGLYKILQILNMDSREMLVYSPRLLVALLTWAGDVALVEAARRLWGSHTAGHTAWSLATSWCLFYCGSRTLANTVEMALLAMALRRYPWRPWLGDPVRGYLWLGALAAVLRPTAALTWLPLWLADFSYTSNKCALLLTSSAAGLAAAAACLLVDSLGHGAPLFSPITFVRWNVLGGVASHYGTSPWHAHLTASLPTLLGLHAVPALLAARRPGRTEGVCLAALLWLVTVYSALPHKEFRFLLPAWPFCALLAGKGFSWLSRTNRRCCSGLKLLILLTNVAAALYLGLVHQRGPLDVTSQLVTRLHDGPLDKASILYLMPCHSTPLYSHLHLNVTTRFLTCEPNLAAAANYVDEADQFYSGPLRWLRHEYPSLLAQPAAEPAGRRLPSHIILFDGLWRTLAAEVRGFTVCASVFHAHASDERRGGRILVLCRDGWAGD